MGSIPAAVLPIVVATDGQPARDPITGEPGDSAFEQALEKEISLISPEAAKVPADPAATALPISDPAATALPISDPAVRGDSTQILEVILDSTGMLASGAAVAAGTPLVAESTAPRADPGLEIADDPALRSPRLTRAPENGRRDGALQLSHQIAASTPAAPAPPAGEVGSESAAEIAKLSDTASDVTPQAPERLLSAAHSSAPLRAMAAAAAAPVAPPNVALAAAAGAPAAMPEMLASVEKPIAAPAAPGRPGIANNGVADKGREALKARSLADELLAPRIELRSDRIAPEPAALSVNAAPLATPDFAARETIARVDALPSATLIHGWTPAPQHASAAGVPPTVVRIDAPLAAPGWSESFRQQVVWLVDQQLQTAELHVNPPHLGPVDVVLKVADDGARIVFCSPHAAVREAIEASLAGLRSSLAERGLALGEALVSADPGSAREQMMRDQNARGAPRSSDAAPAAPERQGRVPPQRHGLIDTFV